MSLFLFLALALTSCSDVPEQKPVTKSDSTKTNVQLPAMTITEVLKKYTDEWMEIPGVIGTGEGQADGKPAVLVFVEERSDTIDKKIPKTIEGHKVVIEVTGEIKALDN